MKNFENKIYKTKQLTLHRLRQYQIEAKSQWKLAWGESEC